MDDESYFLDRSFFAVLGIFFICMGIPVFLQSVLPPARLPVFTAVFLAVVPMHAALLLCITFFASRGARTISLPELLGFRKLNSSDLLRVLPLLFLILVVLTMLLSLEIREFSLYFGWKLPKQDLVRIFSSGKTPVLILILATSVFLAPFSEELVFRRIIRGRLAQLIPDNWAAVSTAILFALVHLNLSTFLPLFVMGLILQLAYDRTRSIWAPLLLHSGFNLTSAICLLVTPSSNESLKAILTGLRIV